MKIQMLGCRIAVEPLNKVKKQSFIVMPESNENTGVIKYLGKEYDGSLQVEQVVCFGDQKQPVTVSGEDLIIMEPDNVFAILEDESIEEPKVKEIPQ